MGAFVRSSRALAFGAFTSIALSTAAVADENKFGYSITISGASDYLFRGISLTDEKPAFQPYIEFTYGIGYLGIWGSNIGSRELAAEGFQATGPWEVDVYAGIRPVVGPVNFDLAVLWYTYGARTNPGGLTKGDLDYVELKASASTSPIKNWTFGLTGYFTPDQDLAIPQTATVEGSVAYELPHYREFAPSLTAQIGYATSWSSKYFGNGSGPFVGDDAYAYWNAGLKVAVDKFFLDFRYWDTSVDAPASLAEYQRLADSRFLFTAGVTLP
ncbi:TorF family putative porin [Hyphomicrobium sp.]|uniref:TorF family putative porin n=1 Tax=Hyphomicrobium sp. TaxID=82 RepID=UPI001D9D0035|nr:TorF family putative porin [Hyphomicrobium sp.]MBY0558532.1 TorF family putative porin [Hyphomicrobium sp.]